MNLLKSSQSGRPSSSQSGAFDRPPLAGFAPLRGLLLLPIAMLLIGHHCGLVPLLSVLGPDGFPLLAPDGAAVLAPNGAPLLAGLGVRRIATCAKTG